MASLTLEELTEELCGTDGTQGVLQDSSYYAGITTRINDVVTAIAAGIRMPSGIISPPLPDLFDTDTVTTSTTLPYVTLPTDYQRGFSWWLTLTATKSIPLKVATTIRSHCSCGRSTLKT